MNQYTIVIPCYNESDSLPELIDQLNKLSSNFNFILVDNGSTDNTQNILNNLEISENIMLIKKDINTGYGAGIKFGLNKVETKYSGWMHADLQQNAKVLLNAKKIIDNFKEQDHHKFLALKGLRSGRSFSENFFTCGVALICSFLFFRKCWDIAGQPNIFKTSSLQFIDSAPDNHNFEFYVYLHYIISKGKFIRFNAPFYKRKFGISSWDKGFRSKLNHSKNILKYILYFKFNH
tara:strand:- start:156 stop:857 length:702 start_codon:yes stop_codon:yes gene_type:complete